MAPKLKILNVLWVHKRNPDILSFSIQKVPASKSLPGSLGADVIHAHEGILVRVKSTDVGITA
jgi:hypothetical protein